jgi:hypothetical protein
MENSHIITTYLIYLSVSISLTLYVAHILFKNGKVYMLDIFHGREDIALATNRLFEVGFYLFNIGFALTILEVNFYNTVTYQEAIEILSKKIGGFSIYLGMMLFFNLYLFFRGKKAAKRSQQQKEKRDNSDFGADYREEQIIY